MQMINHDELKRNLNYCHETGLFFWAIDKYCVKKGEQAGTLDADGYVKITLNYKSHLAHRLAWFYVYGAFPDFQIDHINRIRSDNRIENLRAVTAHQNSQNQSPKKNSSGVPGVTWHMQRNKWRSEIRVNGKKCHLGLFDSIEDAAAAYRCAKEKHHPFFAGA